MVRNVSLNTFYASDKWRKLRLNLIIERGNKCSKCGSIVKPVRMIGHHTPVELTPDNVNDANIALNPNNIEIVCLDCHNKDHKRFGNYKKEVYIVYGPPMSGKTTFVHQRKSNEDIVIDIDNLYEAITMLPRYEKPNRLYQNIVAIQNALLDQVKTRFGKWGTAWIIGGYADKYKRDKLSRDLGAELIYIQVDQEECLKRLGQDDHRRLRSNEWKQYINKWFDDYRE